MPNYFYNEMNNQGMPQNNIMQIINDIKNFKNSFNVNPKEEVQKLLNTGQMTQQQFNQLSQMANQIFRNMPK